MLEKSKWIWTSKQKNNQFVRFKVDFNVSGKGKEALFEIAAETKYYLYLNGELVVFDGGLHRESYPGGGYYDEVVLNTKPGANTLLIDVWYWGNGGRNNNAFAYAGVTFASEELGIYSDENTLCGILPAYYEPQGEQPAYLYGGYNIGYDARKEEVEYEKARVTAENGQDIYGTPRKRPIPLFAFGKNVAAEYVRKGDISEVKLPYAMQFSPYLKVRAKGGEQIDIRSDRYYVNGGPGDPGVYRGHRYEYTCKEGEQEYSGYNYIFGEKYYSIFPKA